MTEPRTADRGHDGTRSPSGSTSAAPRSSPEWSTPAVPWSSSSAARRSAMTWLRVEDAIVELVADLSKRHDVAAVGIGAAGFVDASRSTVMFSPHLAWRNEPLRARVASRIHLPVVVDNDGNTSALGGEPVRCRRRPSLRRVRHPRHRHRGRPGPGRPGLPRRQRHGRRVRPHAGRRGRPPLPVRQPGLLGAVRVAATRWSGRRASSSSRAHRWPTASARCAAVTRPGSRARWSPRRPADGDPLSIELLADVGPLARRRPGQPRRGLRPQLHHRGRRGLRRR